MAMQPTDPSDSTRAGQTGSFPFVPPPPPGGPPTPAPFGPPPPTTPPPAFTSGPAGTPTTTRVAVTNRILWIGQAAYPLANVARVGTSLIVPGRRRALLRLLAFGLVVFLPVLVIAQATDGSSSDSGSGTLFLVAMILVALYFLIFTWPVLRRPDLYVLAVDTAGPPTAVLAWLTAEPAFELQATITRAIENPQAEFQQIVQTISVDLRQYQFGDSVNIYGGQGNTGVSK
ncbi:MULTISPECIES: DUF6232 family protein [Streptomycetaceae]|uniref:DUF6232 family protein n=1 Tax=Streptomycetaceae TaxID=2062 RepID=UPI0009A22126|nr:DUF6232 family protein [Streptomyces sp. CB02056]